MSRSGVAIGRTVWVVACAFGGLSGCTSDDPVSCGTGTVLTDGICVPTANVDDRARAPTFEGVTAVAPASTTSLFVTWNEAKSATTPPERMRYAIFFAANGSAAIDYAKPNAVTMPGASWFEIPNLEARTYDVAVRALDEEGRSDANAVVKSLAPALDERGPEFEGARSAEPAGAGAVRIAWPPASDDHTPPEAIVYYVYVGPAAAPFDLSRPTLVTRPGATSAVVSGLYDTAPNYRFVVRARDAAENVDANDVIVTSRAGADVTPPTFAGCKVALADSAGSAVVSWDPAVDDTTPADKIGYDVYAARRDAAFDFTNPQAVAVGASTVKIGGLASNTIWRFICRARDFTGNREENVLERSAKTLLDDTPPTFAGLTSAQIDGIARTVRLTWAPGTDERTPQELIVYDVYEGTSSGAESFSTPRASSAPGALEITIEDLLPDRTLYWVVRARDQGGNHDTNTVEASGAIAVSFSRQVQQIFTRDCAVSGCHVPGNPMGGLILADGFAYGSLVNVTSTQKLASMRVAPSDSNASYLWEKISKNPPTFGWQMPAPATGSVLSPQEQDVIRRWIDQGAVRN